MEGNTAQCEVCGEPATCGVVDCTVDRNPAVGGGYVERKPLGPMHHLCEEHQRESVENDITMLEPRESA